MNIKLLIHFMPWEIDHALIFADKLKQSIYNVKSDDVIYIDSALNLSSFNINWNESKISKEYFIEKYKLFDTMVNDKFVHKPFIYEGDSLYGHLDLHKISAQTNIDYYIIVCPDIDFSTSLLYYLIESAKSIKNEYFIITPQIFRCWDNTWDILVNDLFLKYDYKQCTDINIHDIRHQLQSSNCNDVEVSSINTFKYAGWFDLYNKNFFEKLAPPLDEWRGYGPWDFYSMNICDLAKSLNVDVKQYLLKNEIVWFYDVGCLQDFSYKINGEGALKTVYKNLLVKNVDKPTQIKKIHNDMRLNLNKWIEYAKRTEII